MRNVKDQIPLKTKVISVVCLVFILASSVLILPSCDSQDNVGIVSATINENGELVLIYQDGNEQNLGVVVGKDGENGIDGEDGSNGADGIDGQDGKLVIEREGNLLSSASQKGLRSAVSIVCNFTKTIQTSGHRPGSSSTSTSSYSSAGSGVIYALDKSEGDAFIITNYHVVYDSSSDTSNGVSDDISIYLYGSEFEEMAIEATYIGGSLYYDIAVLRVEDNEILKNSDAIAVSIANSDQVLVGADAIAIGNAQGYGIAASFGAVSVESEYITMTAADGSTTVSFRVMRVDTAVNSGNSGGGLFDCEGNLIGIVNAKVVSDGVEGIGYAIPSNVAVSIAENIIDYCYGTDVETVQRCLLGVTVNVSASEAEYDVESGAYRIKETISVYEVSAGSLAENILEENDIFVSISVNDGESKSITRQHHIIDLMLDVRAGDVLEITVLREGVETSLTITITEDCITSY